MHTIIHESLYKYQKCAVEQSIICIELIKIQMIQIIFSYRQIVKLTPNTHEAHILWNECDIKY